MASERELIDAVNLICDHVVGKLPDGWEILIRITGDEATSELSDPNGDDVDGQPFGEYGLSSLTSMIDYAKEHDHLYEQSGE